MHDRVVHHPSLVLSASLLLGLPLGARPAQELDLLGPEVVEEAPRRLIEPGPRWTGRWIVHVERDRTLHRARMLDLGTARRARDRAALDLHVAEYAAEMEALQLPVIDLALASGAGVVGTNWLVNTIGLEDVSADLLEALLARDDVRLVQADAWADAQMEIATDAAHHNSDAANLQQVGGIPVDGTGFTLAIVDSGIDADHAGSGRPHAAFFPNGDPSLPVGPGIGGSRILSSMSSSVFGGGQPDEDSFGHGTRMASIAAGAQFNQLPDVDDAPAPNAFIRSYKISDDSTGGLASVLSMDKAFQDLLQDPDVVVANMSYNGTNDALASPNRAIDDAALADVFVTLSAGNFGTDLSFAHAAFNSLAVGASAISDKTPLNLPGFVISAIGPLADGRRYPQLLAVGEALTCASMDDESGSIDSYGTSGAAALTAGSALLLRQADPSLDALSVKALLLNASDEVTQGDPNGGGYGYLRTDLAVQGALDGMVVRELITPGFVKKHPRFFTTGDEIVLTLTWNRELSGSLSLDDLDLRIRDPFGTVLAWSASASDNIEQIRLTAPTTGLYQVEVLAIQFDGDAAADYALAGVDTQSIDPSNCTPGLPFVLQQSPAAIPALTNAAGVPPADPVNMVTLVGCNFTGVFSVQVGAKAITPLVANDNTLTFDLGIADDIGTVPITLRTLGGDGNATLNVVAADNVLSSSPTIDVGMLHLDIGGQPGDLYVIAYSTDLIPTVVPGFFSVDIGNGGATLFPSLFGTLNAVNGVEEFFFTGVPGIQGSAVYFQGVTVDGTSLTLPATATNVSTSFVF